MVMAVMRTLIVLPVIAVRKLIREIIIVLLLARRVPRIALLTLVMLLGISVRMVIVIGSANHRMPVPNALLTPSATNTMAITVMALARGRWVAVMASMPLAGLAACAVARRARMRAI